MSCAVVYRSDARFESAFKQIRSSSLGIVSSIWRGRPGLRPHDLCKNLFVHVAPERPTAGEHLVKDDS